MGYVRLQTHVPFADVSWPEADFPLLYAVGSHAKKGKSWQAPSPPSQKSHQAEVLKSARARTGGPPGDDGGAGLLGVLEEEEGVGGGRAGIGLGDHDGTPAQPPVDVVGPEGGGVVGQDDGVGSARRVVDGDDGALGEVLHGGGG